MDPSIRAAKMTSCKDCGGEISKRADRCPHCGAPRIRWGVIAFAMGLAIFIWIMFALIFSWAR